MEAKDSQALVPGSVPGTRSIQIPCLEQDGDNSENALVRSLVRTKACIDCGIDFPLTAFYRDKTRTDGRTKQCGSCKREYNRQHRRKSNVAPIGPDYLVDADSGCWLWQKRLTEDGYGELVHDGTVWKAHRWFYTQHIGEIPEQTLDHTCQNKICVNRAHLNPLSYADHAALEWRRRKAAA